MIAKSVCELRPKASASFYDKTGVQLFFIKNLKWPLLIHWYNGRIMVIIERI